MNQGIAFNSPSTSAGAILADISALNDRQLTEGIIALVQHRPQVQETLVTRLADQLIPDDYGRGVHDRISPETHPHSTMYVSRYPNAGAGAAAFVTYADPQSGEVYVLLGLKPQGDLVPPGGHLEVHEPIGGNPQKPYDLNLREASRRELMEETGLVIPKDYTPASLGANSDFGVVNDPRLHTVLEGFDYNLIGPKAQLPHIEGKDDIIGAYWVKASDIIADPSVGPQLHGSNNSRYSVQVQGAVIPIRDHYGPQLEEAVATARATLLDGYAHRMQARNINFDPSQKPLDLATHASWKQLTAALLNTRDSTKSWVQEISQIPTPGSSAPSLL